jgi:hypothetical protein
MEWAAAFEKSAAMASGSYSLSGQFFDNQFALGQISPASLALFNTACSARSPKP